MTLCSDILQDSEYRQRVGVCNTKLCSANYAVTGGLGPVDLVQPTMNEIRNEAVNGYSRLFSSYLPKQPGSIFAIMASSFVLQLASFLTLNDVFSILTYTRQ